MSKTYFEAMPTCDECDQEISGPVIKKGVLSLCRTCAEGKAKPRPLPPALTIEAPIAPTVALPLPPLEIVTAYPKKVKTTHLQIDLTRPMCAVIDCQRPCKGRHLCQYHWVVARKTGQLDAMPKANWAAAPENIDASKPGCAAIGCNHDRYLRGFCHGHYNNIHRNKLQHLLLAPARTKKSYLRTRPPRYKTPMPMIREIVRHRKEGNTWHQSALLAGAEQPTLAANRAKNLLLCGKII